MKLVLFLPRALMEAQDIFGLDFDPAELEKLAREGLPSDEEEEEEDDQYNVHEEFPPPSLPLPLSLSLPLSLLSPTCDDELWQWFLISSVASASNG